MFKERKEESRWKRIIMFRLKNENRRQVLGERGKEEIQIMQRKEGIVGACLGGV